MNEHQIYQSLCSLEAAKGAQKKVLLKDYLQDQDFVQYVQMALDADIAYNVGALPDYEESPVPAPAFKEVLLYLKSLSKQRGVNDEERHKVFLMASASEERWHLVNRIVTKDLRCGVQAKTINSVVPHTIFRVPYQRCSGESKIDRISYPAIVQEKANGMFTYALGEPHPRNNLPFLTRNGNGFHLFFEIENLILPFLDKDLGTAGEMLVMGEDGKFLDRQTGNGILNSFIQEGEGGEELAKRIHYHIWRIVPRDFIVWGLPDKAQYIQRYEQAVNLVNIIDNPRIKIIESEPVNNEQEARAFYRKIRARKGEGAILKNFDSPCKDTTSTSEIKLKNISEGEFRIVEAYYGEKGKKWEYLLGGLIVRSECGQVVTRFGKGFSDEERKRGVDWWNQQAGKIVTGKFTEVIDDKTDRETKCLDGGSFVETRFNEKTEADTLEYLMEISQ